MLQDCLVGARIHQRHVFEFNGTLIGPVIRWTLIGVTWWFRGKTSKELAYKHLYAICIDSKHAPSIGHNAFHRDELHFYFNALANSPLQGIDSL